MDAFLPDGYRSPVGNYMKFEIGENTFRVMSSAIVGYEYWNNKDEPVRSRTEFVGTPRDIRVKDGKAERVKHFWAFVVWNVEAKKLQILQIGQSGIQTAIKAYVSNKKWGDPKGYDLTVTKEGSGFDTEYTVMANPHTPVEPEAETALAVTPINLEALYDNGDPFGGEDEIVPIDEGAKRATGEVSADEEFDALGEGTAPAKPKSLGGN